MLPGRRLRWRRDPSQTASGKAGAVQSYCSFGSEQDGNRLVSVTVFDDRETALAASERVREVIAAELRDMFPNPPGIAAGPTFAAATA